MNLFPSTVWIVQDLRMKIFFAALVYRTNTPFLFSVLFVTWKKTDRSRRMFLLYYVGIRDSGMNSRLDLGFVSQPFVQASSCYHPRTFWPHFVMREANSCVSDRFNFHPTTGYEQVQIWPQGRNCIGTSFLKARTENLSSPYNESKKLYRCFGYNGLLAPYLSPISQLRISNLR